MFNFLTVEDINSVLLNYNWINDFYMLDLSLFGSSDFSNEFVDFIKVSKNSSDYTFEIRNSLWTGSFYVLDSSGYKSLSVNDYSYSNNVLSISGLSSSDKLVLYLSSFYSTFNLHYLSNIVTNGIDLDLFDGNLNKEFDFEALTGSISSVIFSMGDYSNTVTDIVDNNVNIVKSTGGLLDEGVYSLTVDNDVFYGYLKRTINIPQINISGDLYCGIINTLTLTSDENDCIVRYDGKILNLTSVSSTSSTFEIDLCDKFSSGFIHLSVFVPAHEDTIEYTFDLRLTYNVYSPVSFSDLKGVFEDSVIPLINIDTDFMFSDSVVVGHDILVVGNDNVFDMNDEYNLIIDESVNFTCNNIQFKKGKDCITQKTDSQCILNNCSFSNCTNTVITQDTTIPKIYDNTTNILLKINECEFTNNNSPYINSTGTLQITNSKFTTPNNINIDNPAFINLISGDATITKSDFRIQKNNINDCTNETETGFNQCLLMIGDNATINNVTYNNLQENNSLPLFNVEHGNTSYLFYRYYHPQAETCVIVSPEIGFEEKACSHCLHGLDYIFKNNVKITRVSWNSENTNGYIGD